ncbi:MAG: glycosyltransferase family 39 protein [Syntrophorhabdaceae bacterium]|nr:glycosyltransferase family 39 protein [Syntrophorhabdaceae bacterium]
MMLPGLSIRSLWGSEGRWAVIAREMMESGNYFLPTINGMVYFDKPLLSYWVIIPFSLKSGVTESAVRMPSALSGILACIIVFLIGKRLFDSKTGFISGILLLTTVMFLFWARHGSADMFNLLFIWIMFLFFTTGGIEGRFLNLMAIYIAGAISSFFKGPAGASVVFFSICFYSFILLLINLQQRGLFYKNVKEEFLKQFRWVASWRGMTSISIGVGVFFILLFLPVWITGSWESVRLMWRENIERFFRPFDHIEPAYAYIKHIAVFTLPWTILVAASFFRIKNLWREWSGRYIILVSSGIFIFFLLSGSRRSYYILPLIPGLMIIVGKMIKDWLEGTSSYVLKAASILSALLISLSGIALAYAYLKMDDLRHISQIFLPPFLVLAGITSIFFFYRDKKKKGLVLLFLTFFIFEVWIFNTGMAITEKQRGSLKVFSLEAKEAIKTIDKEKVVIFKDISSSVIFYLNMGRIKEIHTKEDLMEFRKTHPDGLVIADMKNLDALKDNRGCISLEPIIVEKKQKEKEERLALFRFRKQED